MGNAVEKKNLDGLLVVANSVIAVILVGVRLIAPIEYLAWDVVTILLAVCSLFISQTIIRRNAAEQNAKITKMLAVGMSSFAGIMIIASAMIMFI